ncbi:unnamed protein product [Fraxinus pennsylvanica]|uniref:BED-type domain-containing protein n=1 Tax=Fraxinus pennsylvanica TaxID=56036 RepID=A0AAD1ZUT2_9LAMI|nr:unnamed protein product [Fraxinus pennsylvanica]
MASLRSAGYVDPGWEHGAAQDERKKKVRCNYCGKVVSGGIYRLKQHLARISGEVTYCDKAPEEVCQKMRENLEGCRFGKKARQIEYDEQSFLNFHANDDVEEEEHAGYRNKGRRHGRPGTKEISSFYVNSENEDEEEEEEEKEDIHHLGNDKLFLGDKRYHRDLRRSFKGISQGNGPEPSPKRPRFDANILMTPKSQMQASGKQMKTSSSSRSRREVTSAICKFFYHAGVPLHAANSPYFHKMLDLVGQHGPGLVGPSSQLLSGRFLQDELLTIKNYLAEYKSSWAVTGCSILADSWQDMQEYLFKMLDRVVEETGEENVVQVITENTPRIYWRFSKLDVGKEVKSIVLDSSFWRKVQYVRRSVDPIVEVLQKINGDQSLSMPFIYNDMYRAKLAIKINHNDDAHKYGPFWSVIDNHWSSLFHHPLYLAAYFLNPSYRYRPEFVPHPDVVRGLNACIVRLEPDSARRISASMQISDFGSAKADFGTDLAISTRSELDPAAWWQQHGINCLELQKIAIRKRSCDVVSSDCVLQERLLYDWIVETEKQALQEDEEILYSEMEQGEAYETDLMDFEDGNADSRKRSIEMVSLGNVVEPLELYPTITDAATDDDDDDDDDDADLNFLDDNLSD